GDRWILNNIARMPLRSWDSRDHQTRQEYDTLRRPTRLLVRTNGGSERLAELIAYGEDQRDDLARNLRGKVFQQFDNAGVVTNYQYDFKGNLLRASRQLFR